MRIALYGGAGVGKDYIAEKIVYKTRKYKVVHRVSFAEAIYKLAKKHFNMTEKDRRIIVGLGESAREIYYNVWVDKLHEKIKDIGSNEGIIVTDLRRFNEYYYLISEGFLPIRIVTNEAFTPQGVNNEQELLLGGHTKGELDDVPMITITNTKDQLQLNKLIDYIIANYDDLYAHRLTGGNIKMEE